MNEELKTLIEGTAAETRRHFDVVAARLESKIDTVAEGVITVNERVDRLSERLDRFESVMKQEFADVRSMIKFSHRVERLESSTH